MKNTTNIATLAACLCAALLSAETARADTYTWTSGNGDWSDESKWANATQGGVTGKGFPSASGDIARFYSDAGSVTVRVDGDYAPGELSIMAGTVGNPLPVTLTGSGKLTLGSGSTATTLNVFANRQLTLAGAEVEPNGVQYIFNSAKIVVSEGSVFRPRYLYVHEAGARLVVDGGEVRTTSTGGGYIWIQNGWNAPSADGNIGFVDVVSGLFDAYLYVKNGTLNVSGGVCNILNSSAAVFSEYGLASITGGEVHLNLSRDYPVTAPPGIIPNGGTLVLGAGTTIGPLSSEGMLDLSLNGGEICGGGKLVATHDFSMTGGGNLTFGGGMVLSPNVDDPISNVVFDVDSITLGANLSRPYVQGGVGDKTGTNLYMHLPRPITFAATNADWFVGGLKTTMIVEKGITVDTTDRADGTTPRKISLRKPTFLRGAHLRTVGCGEVMLSIWSDIGGRLSEFSVGGTTYLTFEWSAGQWFTTDSFSLAAGAKIRLPLRANIPVDADTATFGAGSCIQMNGSSAKSGLHSPILIGPESISAGGILPEVELPDTSVWTNEFVNGSIVLWKKSETPASSTFSGNRWTGAIDGTFETDGNWSSSAPFDTSESAVFDGIANAHVTVNGSGVSLYALRFLDTAGPFVLDGGKIKLESRNYNGVNSTIYSASQFPVIICNDIERADTSGSHAMIAINNAGYGYTCLEGAVNGYARFDIRGDVRVRGNLTAWNLRFYDAEGGKPTRFTVYDGATVTASNQTLAHSGPKDGMHIKSGGTVTIANHSGSVFWGYSSYGDAVPSVVDGLFDIQVPLGGSVGHWYTGSGRVKMKDTGSAATADYSIRLGGSVKFSAETFVKPITVEETPTLCSESAWTYAAGALTLPKGSELTIDTQDPDNAVGYDCTFASPITGDGALKVKGAGSLTLTAENSIGGGVTLAGGTLVYTAPQTIGSLSGTGTLTVGGAGGSVPTLTVAGDADLSGITIGGDSLGELGAAGWVTLATFPAGATVTGEPTMPSGEWQTRVVDNGDGTKSLKGRIRTGVMLIVR